MDGWMDEWMDGVVFSGKRKRMEAWTDCGRNIIEEWH